ncbi:MAG TPA: HD domain-containing protein [Firmicutes bacterium]|nr:HD domain-containing protein [Bacillota bacterium]
MNKSKKEEQLEKEILKGLTEKPLQIAEYLFNDQETHALQEYANVVSIKRLGYNDHGPVHMRKTVLNSIQMANLLNKAGVRFNLEKEMGYSYSDSLSAIIMAALFHDIGMGVSRNDHEFHGAVLASPIITRTLAHFFNDPLIKAVLHSLVLEGITGHMAAHPVHSLEAGVILVGDGCDMEHGRARITTMLSKKPKIGDIHRYSATAINRVEICAGKELPIRISVEMESTTGFFQVEEVLYPKINNSPVKKFIELYAGKTGEAPLRYL